MELIYTLIATGLVITGILVLLRLWPTARIVMEHERALRYRRGRLLGEVGPGRYWLRAGVDDLRVLDMRRRQMLVAGQEVLTRDRVPVKISLVAAFSVEAPTTAVTSVENFEGALYTRLQLALREAVAALDLEDALAGRGELGAAIQSAVAEPAAELGLTLHATQVRDYMMAGGLRQSFADVLQAKQEGLAALERARGESAALRNLANSAQLMERHPGLLKLRLLQAVQEGSGNRVLISLDGEAGAAVNAAAED